MKNPTTYIKGDHVALVYVVGGYRTGAVVFESRSRYSIKVGVKHPRTVKGKNGKALKFTSMKEASNHISKMVGQDVEFGTERKGNWHWA